MYKYFAKDKNGEVIKGQIDAPSREYATSMINSMGLYLISLNEEKKSILKLHKSSTHPLHMVFLCKIYKGGLFI